MRRSALVQARRRASSVHADPLDVVQHGVAPRWQVDALSAAPGVGSLAAMRTRLLHTLRVRAGLANVIAETRTRRFVRVPRRLRRLSQCDALRWLQGEPPREIYGASTALAWQDLRHDDALRFERFKSFGLRIDRCWIPCNDGELIVAWVTLPPVGPLAHLVNLRITERDLRATLLRVLWELAYPHRGLGFPKRLRERRELVIARAPELLSQLTGIPRSILFGTEPGGIGGMPGEAERYYQAVRDLQLSGAVYSADIRDDLVDTEDE